MTGSQHRQSDLSRSDYRLYGAPHTERSSIRVNRQRSGSSERQPGWHSQRRPAVTGFAIIFPWVII